jgi:hypothetical protein
MDSQCSASLNFLNRDTKSQNSNRPITGSQMICTQGMAPARVELVSSNKVSSKQRVYCIAPQRCKPRLRLAAVSLNFLVRDTKSQNSN